MALSNWSRIRNHNYHSGRRIMCFASSSGILGNESVHHQHLLWSFPHTWIHVCAWKQPYAVLKETCYYHQVHNFSSGCCYNRFTCICAQKIHQLHSGTYYPSERLWFSSCLFKVLHLITQSALIGQLTHTWASIAQHVSRQLCRVFIFQLASRMLWI